MNVWAIGDLHLAFGVPEKTMEVFGPNWAGYAEHIETHWHALVEPEDLVLIPGDISWALSLEDAKVDLDWIERLPGTKALIKGNHDYWWGSLSKVQKILPPSLHLVQNNAFNYQGISIAGTRLWDTPEYHFGFPLDKDKKEEEKIFNRELQRLEMSLQCLDKQAKCRIAMTHYPPIGADLQTSRVSELLDKYGVDICVFGHLHNFQEGTLPFGKLGGVTYHLTSSDYLRFQPLKIYSSTQST